MRNTTETHRVSTRTSKKSLREKKYLNLSSISFRLIFVSLWYFLIRLPYTIRHAKHKYTLWNCIVLWRLRHNNVTVFMIILYFLYPQKDILRCSVATLVPTPIPTSVRLLIRTKPVIFAFLLEVHFIPIHPTNVYTYKPTIRPWVSENKFYEAIKQIVFYFYLLFFFGFLRIFFYFFQFLWLWTEGFPFLL